MPMADRSPPSKFNVVVMYEDVETRRQARKGLDYVVEEFGSDFDYRHSMWQINDLEHPKLSGRAASFFAESDLLIISLHGRSGCFD